MYLVEIRTREIGTPAIAQVTSTSTTVRILNMPALRFHTHTGFRKFKLKKGKRQLPKESKEEQEGEEQGSNNNKDNVIRIESTTSTTTKMYQG